MKKRQFTAIITLEDDMYVSFNPETGVASQGTSIEEATANLREALELYLEEVGKGPEATTPQQRAFVTTVEV